jgi:hypothetical protein
MIGIVQAFANDDLVYERERKSSGPSIAQDYDRGLGKAKTKETTIMTGDEDAATPSGEEDHVKKYNELVEEAKALGLTAKPISRRFRDPETGAKRCEALAEAIEAQRAKIASGEVETAAPPEEAAEEAPPPSNQETKKMVKSSTAKKPAAKKVVAKKAARAKPVAAQKAAAEKRNGPAGEFGTREGTNREKVLLVLHAKKNKPVTLTEVAKSVYGKGDDENRLKVKAVIVGLNMMIEEKRLPYKPVEYEGRGEETTVTLASKSGR